MAKRSRALERKKEREKQRQRNQQFLIIGAIVLVVLVVGGLLILSNVPAEVTIPDTLDRYENIRTGFTDEGFPRLGNPEAPITVTEFSSFSCPACQQFHESVFPQLLDRIRQGVIQFVFVPLDTGSIPNPDGANRTALCAGEQGQFWEMHDVLFNWHEIYVNAAFQDNRLRAGVDALGLDSAVFTDCFRSQRTEETLVNARAQGVGVTPSVQINGVAVDASLDAINEAIDGFSIDPDTLAPGTISTEEDTPPESDVAATEESAEDATEAVEEATEAATEEPEAEATEAPETEATEEPES